MNYKDDSFDLVIDKGTMSLSDPCYLFFVGCDYLVSLLFSQVRHTPLSSSYLHVPPFPPSLLRAAIFLLHSHI